MKYEEIGKELFILNRNNLKELLKPGSLAVLNSNDIMPTNADGNMPFRQNNDLFYLSGIDQEESILVLFPEFHDPKYREILFLKKTNEHIAVWEGHKYTKEEATAAYTAGGFYYLNQCFPSSPPNDVNNLNILTIQNQKCKAYPPR